MALDEDVHAGIWQIGERLAEGPAPERRGGFLPAPGAGDFRGGDLRQRLDQPAFEKSAFFGPLAPAEGEYAVAEHVAVDLRISHPRIIRSQAKRGAQISRPWPTHAAAEPGAA